MEVSLQAAQSFLTTLSVVEKNQLLNDLLALQKVHMQNCGTHFYTFRRAARSSRRAFECHKRTYRYTNMHNDELIINQIHQQRLFKNIYRIEIFFNMQEVDYSFVDALITLLWPETLQVSYA